VGKVNNGKGPPLASIANGDKTKRKEGIRTVHIEG